MAALDVLRTTSATEPSVFRYELTLRLLSPLVAPMRTAPGRTNRL